MRSNKGFSLVELIVVIAIMAILASVAVVSFSAYIGHAKDAADAEYLHNIVYRAELFATEKQIELIEVVVAPEVNGPEDIKLVIGYENGQPIYYDGDTSEIYAAVGNATVQGGLNNGKHDPNLPDIVPPEPNEGNQEHHHVLTEEYKAPTCRSEGYRKQSCECGYVKTERLGKIAHDHKEKSGDDKFVYLVCDMCGDIIIKSIDGAPIVPIG